MSSVCFTRLSDRFSLQTTREITSQLLRHSYFIRLWKSVQLFGGFRVKKGQPMLSSISWSSLVATLECSCGWWWWWCFNKQESFHLSDDSPTLYTYWANWAWSNWSSGSTCVHLGLSSGSHVQHLVMDEYLKGSNQIITIQLLHRHRYKRGISSHKPFQLSAWI